MTNKQLAKQLRDIGNSLFDRTNDPNFKLLLDEASDRLENQSKWISVEERLPEKSGDYLTYFNGIFSTLMYSAKHRLFNAVDSLSEKDCLKYNMKVSHWMPFPEAPNMKGGAE